MEYLDIFFYVVCGPLVLYSIYFSGVPLLSFTGLYLRMVLVLLYIPAYYIYRGGINYAESSSILPFVYFLLFFQNIFSAFAAILVWRLKFRVEIKFMPRKNHLLLYLILIGLVFVYTISYFAHIQGQIPLLQIFNGELIEAATSRAELTHNNNVDASIFSFYRPITKDLLFILIGALILSRKTHKLFKVIAFIFLSLSLFGHLEKSYVFLLVILLFSINNLDVSDNWRAEIILSLVVAFLLFSAVYIFFSEDIYDSFLYLPHRLMLQTGYVSEQLEIASSFGTLYLEGINLGFVGKMLGIEFIDISKLAWASVHKEMDIIGISGSSAGLASADGYMIFSYIGLLLMPIIWALHFSIDKILNKEIAKDHHSKKFAPVVRSFYLYIISLYPIYLISSFLGFFSIPYIFQPGLLLAVVVVMIMYATNFLIVKPPSSK